MENSLTLLPKWTLLPSECEREGIDAIDILQGFFTAGAWCPNSKRRIRERFSIL
jgi:hypothetical protein